MHQRKEQLDDLLFEQVGVDKNTSDGRILYHPIDGGSSMVICSGKGGESTDVDVVVPAGIIQFTLSADGDARLQFGPHYNQDLGSNECMLLYNPSKELKYRYHFATESRQVFLFLTVEKLHRLLITEADELHFLNESNIGKKYYVKTAMGPQLRMSMDQLYGTQLSQVAARLFWTSKALELLSFYFNTEEQNDFTEKCPFLKDQRNVDAVRRSKEILLENMTDPPTIKDLSLEVGLNEYQLKLGFKNIYGNSMHHYLLDHKLNHALKLMVTDNFKVQEAADAIGYANPSHFISAFKKKFGLTPKKYMMGAARSE